MKACPSCMASASDSDAFCAVCGKSLSSAHAAPSPVSPYAPPAEPASVSPYAPPAEPASVSPYAPPVEPASVSPYAPPVEPVSPYAPPVHPATFNQPAQPAASSNWNPAPVGDTQPPQPAYQPIAQETGWNAPVHEAPQKSPLSRFLGIGAAVLVLGVAATAAFLLLLGTPESKAKSAVEKTQSALETQLDAVGGAMGGNIFSRMEEEPSLMELQMDLSEAIPYMPSGQWLNIKSYSDPKAELVNMQLESSFELNADLFMDSENLTLDAPDFLSYPIAFSYQTLEDRLADGDLSDIFNPGYDDYYDGWDHGLNGFNGGEAAHSNSDSAAHSVAMMAPMLSNAGHGLSPSLYSFLGGIGYSGIDYEAYEEEFNKAAEKLEETAAYSDPKKTTHPDYSGQMECIIVTYPDEAIEKYIEDYIDIMMDMADDVSPDLSRQMMDEIPSISASDFSKTIYIQSGYACVYEFEIRLRIEGEAVNAVVTLQTEDGKKPLDEWSARMVAKASGQEILDYTVEGRGTFSDKGGLDYTIEVAGSVANSTNQRAVMEIQYNPSSSNDNITISVRESSSGLRFSLTGGIAAEKDAVTFTLSRISYDMPGYYGGSGSFDLDASLRCEITKAYQGRSVPSGAEDGFDISAREWENIYEDAMKRIYERIGSFNFY